MQNLWLTFLICLVKMMAFMMITTMKYMKRRAMTHFMATERGLLSPGARICGRGEAGECVGGCAARR